MKEVRLHTLQKRLGSSNTGSQTTLGKVVLNSLRRPKQMLDVTNVSQ